MAPVATRDDDELSAEDPRLTADDVERLNPSERYRLRDVDSELGAAERKRVAARHAAGLDWYSGEPVQPIVYPIPTTTRGTPGRGETRGRDRLSPQGL